MNCKRGDLAYIVPTGRAPYDNRFVEVCAPKGVMPNTVYGGHHWWVRAQGWEPPDCWLDRRGRFILPDAVLRPIRDNDGMDETLAWGIERARKAEAVCK